jgi:hypothetical protein
VPDIEIFARTGEQALYDKLNPLLSGETVAIKVLDVKQRTKKRIGHPTLILVPGKKLGNEDGLVVGLQGFGCEFVLFSELTTLPFIRIGLTAKASKLLVQSLKELYTRSPQ